MLIYRLSIIFLIIFSNNWQNSDFATKSATESAKYCQKNAIVGQSGTTSSWSEGKKRNLFPHFPVKCEFSFPWTYRTKFDAFSDIDDFSIISKFQFFDIDNFANNLTNAALSTFNNFFPIYRWLQWRIWCRGDGALLSRENIVALTMTPVSAKFVKWT